MRKTIKAVMACTALAGALVLVACKPADKPEPEAASAQAAKKPASRSQASSTKASAKPEQQTANASPQAEPGEGLRFDMTQDGQPQTAEKFEAWMDEQGVSVAQGSQAAGSDSKQKVMPASNSTAPKSAEAETN